MNTATQHHQQTSSPVTHKSETPRSVTAEQLGLVSTTFGSDSEVSGKYVGKSGLSIKGQYTGEIQFAEAGVVHIAQGAVVTNTTIDADVVLIEGKFTGVVNARKILEIMPAAHVEGKLSYTELELHRGARVKGELISLHEDTVETQTERTPAPQLSVVQTSQHVTSPATTLPGSAASVFRGLPTKADPDVPADGAMKVDQKSVATS